MLDRFEQPEPAVLVFQGVVGVRVGGHDALEVGLGHRLHVLLGEHFEEPFFAQPADVVAGRLLAVAEDAEIQPRRLKDEGQSIARPASTRDERPRNRRGTRASRRVPSWRLSAAAEGPWPNRTASSATWSANCRSAAARAGSLAACCRVGPVRPVSAAFPRSARRVRCGPGICPRRRGRWRSPKWPRARPCRRRIPSHCHVRQAFQPDFQYVRLQTDPIDGLTYGRPWTVARPLLKTNSLRSWTTCRGDNLAPLAATGQTRSHRPHSAQA